jgi:hypothetical protein
MAYRSFIGGSGRLNTRHDTPPSQIRRHPFSHIALERARYARLGVIARAEEIYVAGGVDHRQAANMALKEAKGATGEDDPLGIRE